MGDMIGKWAVGSGYGPVLTQTELYLLDNVALELHPILAGEDPNFQLIFNIATGQTSGYNSEARDRDLPFTAKDEPATLPRVEQLIIITELSPWCTIVKNPAGVTLSDVCTTLWREYTDNTVTDKELEGLSARTQDQIKRFAASVGTNNAWDWLRERQFFDRLTRKDGYAKQRLGYSAPNILVLSLTHY